MDQLDQPAAAVDGRPRHRRDEALDAPGLYFVRLRFQHRMTSALLGGVGEDTAHVGRLVCARSDAASVAQVCQARLDDVLRRRTMRVLVLRVLTLRLLHHTRGRVCVRVVRPRRCGRLRRLPVCAGPRVRCAIDVG